MGLEVSDDVINLQFYVFLYYNVYAMLIVTHMSQTLKSFVRPSKQNGIADGSKPKMSRVEESCRLRQHHWLLCILVLA